MKKWFVCPDQERIEIDRCLDNCRYPTRCLSPATLALVADDRPFKGVSPSMAGKGDRLIYLEETCYYAVDPRSKMFMTYGTRHHSAKEEYAGKFGEFKLDSGGTIDDYDEDSMTLYDSKFVGTGRLDRIVKKAWLETGEVYKVNYKDKKKGDPKVKPVIVGWNIPDDDDWVYQLNMYRIKLGMMGYPTAHIVVEATLRDGGTGIAIGKCYMEMVYMIPIQINSDSEVLSYYQQKEARLHDAFMNEQVPPICTEEERWNDDMRCKFYCDMFEACAISGGWGYSALRKIVKGRKR